MKDEAGEQQEGPAAAGLDGMNRREAVGLLAAAGVSAATGAGTFATAQEPPGSAPETAIRSVQRLPSTGPWPTEDPFLFCVHHNDQYPAGNGRYGPKAALSGRQLGQDFANKDGWNMYHGRTVPGFPRHPHRGFETVTLVTQGLIDHADSLGAAARYGDGDVQWLTAGDGINHAEMFPLLSEDAANPVDFYQIWVNLPAARKRVPPHFSMFWRDQVPRVTTRDEDGRSTTVRIVAGRYEDQSAPAPPPASWASEAGADVGIWTISVSGGAQWTLPATAATTARSLYIVKGEGVRVGQRTVAKGHRLRLNAHVALTVSDLGGGSELLLLQGRPIGEPVVQHGPFVMNTRAEIQEAFRDYQRTQFGGWPWENDAPVHGASPRRFARLIGGGREDPA